MNLTLEDMDIKAIICAIASAKRTFQKEIRELKQEVRHMADALSDLNASITGLTGAVTATADQIKAETAKILELLAAPAGVDPVAVEAAAQSIGGLAASLTQTVADAQAALNPQT